MQLAWFREPRFGPVASLPRCMDHEACRRRVIEGGETWPLASADERPAFVLPVPASVEPEPEPGPEEATPWFS